MQFDGVCGGELGGGANVAGEEREGVTDGGEVRRGGEDAEDERLEHWSVHEDLCAEFLVPALDAEGCDLETNNAQAVGVFNGEVAGDAVAVSL